MEDTKQDFFDHPPALRTLKGMIMTVNNFISRYALFAMIDFDHHNENLVVLLNCDSASAKQVMQNPIPNDRLELSGMQNFFEQLLPYEIELRMNNQEQIQAFFKKFNLGWLQGPYRKLGLDNSNEKVKLVRHPSTLQAAFAHGLQLQQPGIFTEHNEHFDPKLHSSKLDLTSIRQNVFIEISDQNSITLVPVHVQIDFAHKIRQGISSRFGFG